MRHRIILSLQRFLKDRYNKQIVEIKDPFRDMHVLLAAMRVERIVDAGAYHGEIARRLSTLFPRAMIYAFEPSQASYNTLKERCANYSNIQPVPLALSSKKGIRTLYVNAQTSTNALSLASESGKKYQAWQTENVAAERIPAVRLDDWARSKKVKNIELMKLDVQGHELELLRGAKGLLRSSVRLIYTEVEFVRIYQKNCLCHELEYFLMHFGFELFQLYNLTSGDDGRLVTGDAIFIHRRRVAL